MEQIIRDSIMCDYANYLKIIMDKNHISYDKSLIEADVVILAAMNAFQKWVPKKSWEVKYSKELRAKIEESAFKDDVIGLISHFENKFKNGENLNFNLGRQIFNSKTRDILLNHWKIKHLHLNNVEATSKTAMKANRGDYLLLFISHENTAFFLDVIEHPEAKNNHKFTPYNLLEILHTNKWMSYIGFESMGDDYQPFSLKPQLKDSESIYKMYKNNFNIGFDFDGTGYFSLRGVASTGDRQEDVRALTSYKSELLNLLKKHNVISYGGFKENTSIALVCNENYIFEIPINIVNTPF